MTSFKINTVVLFTIIILVHASGSNVNSSKSLTKNSMLQLVKNDFQLAMKRVAFLFTNDIPHFFGKDVAAKTSDIENVITEDASEMEEENTALEKVAAEIKSLKFEEACVCVNYSCGCCQHLEEPSIHLNSTLCANITYLSEDIGLSLTVTVNDYAIFNETVSVRNPPPICLGVPYVKEYADACFRLYDIDATRTHFHACAQVEARMKHILIAKYDLGCFDIGPFHSSSGLDEFQSQEPSVMLV